MNTIKITNNKIIVSSFDGDKEIKSKELPCYLSACLEIDENVTFERIFNLIIENKNIFNTIFASSLGFYTIDQFIEEYEKSNKKTENKENEIDYLKVSPVFEIFDGELSQYYDFGGICENFYDKENDPHRGVKEPYEMGISISFTPLNELKKYEIKLRKDYVIHNLDTSKIEKGVMDNISLFDFINAILYEITYHGAPDSREEKRKDLNNRLQESIEWIENATPEELEKHSIENFLKELNDEEEE